MRIYLQTVQEQENRPRFYQMLIQKDLLDGWQLVREWGEQGKAGRVKKDYFEDHEDALGALLVVRDAQIKRGYQIVFMHGAEPT